MHLVVLGYIGSSSVSTSIALLFVLYSPSFCWHSYKSTYIALKTYSTIKHHTRHAMQPEETKEAVKKSLAEPSHHLREWIYDDKRILNDNRAVRQKALLTVYLQK